MLRRIGAAAAATTVLAPGTSAAQVGQLPAAHESAAAYERDDAAVRSAMTSHAESVVETLAAEGVDVTPTPQAATDIEVFPDEVEGTPTAHLVLRYERDAETVRPHVKPDAGEAYGVLDRADGKYRVTSDDVTEAADCSTSSSCSDECCRYLAPTPDCDPNSDAKYYITEECCLFADGSYSCDTLSKECRDSCGECCG